MMQANSDLPVKEAKLQPDRPLKQPGIHPDDEPADSYGYTPLARTIVTILDRLDPPFRVAIYGAWGAGKTSLLNMIIARLKGQHRGQVIYFNPWRHNATGRIELFLFKHILDSRRTDERAFSCILSYFKVMWNVLAPALGEASSQIAPIAQAILGTPHAAPFLASLFGAIVRKVIKKVKFKGEPKNTEEFIAHIEEYEEAKADTLEKRKTFFFVDDLDRCDPELVIPFINTVKNLFDVPNTVFVFALDKRMVAEGIAIHYRSNKIVKPYEYLDKIFDLSFALDDYRSPETLDAIVESNFSAAGIEGELCNIEDLKTVFRETRFNNPRQIKKYINVLGLLQNYYSYQRRWDLKEIRRYRREKKAKPVLRRNEVPAVRKVPLTERGVDLSQGINEITLVLLVMYFKWNYLFYEVRQNINLLRRIVEETDKDALMEVLKEYIENEDLLREVFSDSTFVLIQDFLKERFEKVNWDAAQRQINMLEIL